MGLCRGGAGHEGAGSPAPLLDDWRSGSGPATSSSETTLMQEVRHREVIDIADVAGERPPATTPAPRRYGVPELRLRAIRRRAVWPLLCSGTLWRHSSFRRQPAQAGHGGDVPSHFASLIATELDWAGELEKSSRVRAATARDTARVREAIHRRGGPRPAQPRAGRRRRARNARAQQPTAGAPARCLITRDAALGPAHAADHRQPPRPCPRPPGPGIELDAPRGRALRRAPPRRAGGPAGVGPPIAAAHDLPR
jgi:hypothetical protein